MEKALTNLFRKVGRGLTVLAIAPLINLEKKESHKRIEERLKRANEKQLRLAKAKKAQQCKQ